MKSIFYLLDDTELTESIKVLNTYLDYKGKQELGKALSNVYQHGYIDCVNDLASQNHVSVMGIN